MFDPIIEQLSNIWNNSGVWIYFLNCKFCEILLQFK